MTLGFGIFYPSIEEQLKAQGLVCEDVEYYENRRDAINRLNLSELLTDAEAERAFKRLNKLIGESSKKVQNGNT